MEIRRMQYKKDTLLSVGGIAIFVAMATLGWIKLKYGFNFEDEGMYMVDGWRLTLGDRLFPDNAINASMLYVVFNAFIFKIFPNITLLEFRQIQYVLTIVAIIVFGYAIYLRIQKIWPIPLTMSVFAFTGLDTLGNNSNLSYYTYPHLFLIFHIAFLIYALESKQGRTRFFLLTFSGVSLWAIGFSFLPLSVVMISPALFWLSASYFDIKGERISLKEVLIILSPGIILWGGFIAIYAPAFSSALFDIYRYAKESSGGVRINYVSLEYIACVAVFLTIILTMKLLPPRAMLAFVIIFSGLVFEIIDSNMAGLISPYWFGWYSNQMWVCSLLISFIIVFIVQIIRIKRSEISLDIKEGLILTVLIPSAVFVLLFSYFSSIGILSAIYVAIPVTMALALFIIRQLEIRHLENPRIVAATTMAILLPFYYHLAWADWKFTFFDMPPEKLTRTISGGFADGIKTNKLNVAIMQWMEKTALKFSAAGELAIIMDQSPMGYMLINRRPSLNHSWTGWAHSFSLRQEALAEMIKENRQPKIAYRFLHLPIMWPLSLKEGTYTLAAKYEYPSDDPIYEFVKTNMRLVDTYYLNGEPWIEFYVQQ